ncbi:MAG: GNAT family N-acetyltransferase [Candidatus Acidiferrales bacterium]
MDRSPHGTVFHYSWWLDISAERFQILAARDRSGTLVAGIPLPMRRRAGLSLFHSPNLTPYLGPVFDLQGAGGVCDQLFRMRSYGEMLASRISGFDSFRCFVGARGPDLQGFLWAGFRIELAYTFRIPSTQSMPSVAEQITRTHSQKLNKARRLGLCVTRNEGPGAFEALCQMNRQRHIDPLYSQEISRGLWLAAAERGKADLYLARTPEGLPSAALLTVHDSRATYQIVSGFEESLENVQGSYLVLWQALNDALNEGRDFDFEGSSLRGVEQFYRRWGAAAVPVWRITKVDSWRGRFLQQLIDRRDAKRRSVSATQRNA